jgi:hypothetical protein
MTRFDNIATAGSARSRAGALRKAVAICVAGAGLAFAGGASAAIWDFSTNPGAEGSALGTINTVDNILTFTNAIYAYYGGPAYAFRGPPPTPGAQSPDQGNSAPNNPFSVSGNIMFTDALANPNLGPEALIGTTGVPNFGVPTGPITVSFAAPVIGVRFFAGDLDCSQASQTNCPANVQERVVASVFDVNNVLVGSITKDWNAPDAGDGASTLFDLSSFTTPITKLTLTMGTTTGVAPAALAVGFDNLTFTPVPVPAALPLLLSGLGLFGWMARRRAAA